MSNKNLFFVRLSLKVIKNMFCDRLRDIRKRRGMTQEEMAKALNITSVGYGNYERGRNEPDIETLKKLSSILNVSIDELLENDRGWTTKLCAEEIIRLAREIIRGDD